MSSYGVQLLPVGRGEVPGPELFWMAGWEQWYPLEFQASLAIVLGPHGITCNAVLPGAIATDINREDWSNQGSTSSSEPWTAGSFALAA